MIPLRDDVPSRPVRFVNLGPIVLNALLWRLERALGCDGLPRFLSRAAVGPDF